MISPSAKNYDGKGHPLPTVWSRQIVNGDICKITNEDVFLRMDDELSSKKKKTRYCFNTTNVHQKYDIFITGS